MGIASQLRAIHVGVGLLAKTAAQSTLMSSDTPLSSERRRAAEVDRTPRVTAQEPRCPDSEKAQSRKPDGNVELLKRIIHRPITQYPGSFTEVQAFETVIGNTVGDQVLHTFDLYRELQ